MNVIKYFIEKLSIFISIVLAGLWFFFCKWFYLAFIAKVSKKKSASLLKLRLAFNSAINSKLLKLSLILTIWYKGLILDKSLGQLLFESWAFTKLLKKILFVHFSFSFWSLIFDHFSINKMNSEVLSFLLTFSIF